MRMVKLVLAAALAAALGCGGKVGQGADEALHDAAGVTTTPDWAHDRTAELRMLGVDQGGFTGAALYLQEVEVKSGGQVLETKNSQKFLDLAAANEAWLLGRVKVPEGATQLDLRVRFKATGGRYVLGEGSGEIDTGCSEIRITVPVKGLEARGHAVLHVGVAASLPRNGAARVFLPQLKLVY